MLRYSSKPAKREVRTCQKAAKRNEKNYPIVDCWGNRIGYVHPTGGCYPNSISHRQTMHIVVGAMVNTPLAERGRKFIDALRAVRSCKAWGNGGLI
jgi:hypothetical protein